MLKFEDLKRIHVELSSACNAACPSCPRNVDGGYTVPWLKPKTMTLADFKLIFNKGVLEQIQGLLFCGNYGDPVYCRDLPQILQYIASVNDKIEVRIHTNGGIRRPQWWTDLAQSYVNLEVVFSIDGLEDTNHIYRRGVVWQALEANFRAFIQYGGQAVWEFLIFKHNEHQIDRVRELSDSEGFTEVKFKRPFGFDSGSVSYSRMRVLDQQGNLDYFVYPSESDDFRNAGHEQTVDRYENDDGLPPSVLAELHRQVEHQVDSKEFDQYENIETTKLDCLTQQNSEIYIDSSGRLHPCCFLGIGGQDVASSDDAKQYNRWLKNRNDENNCKKYTIQEIMSRDFLSSISDTWSCTHAQGRMLTCSKMCSRQGARDRLYVK